MEIITSSFFLAFVSLSYFYKLSAKYEERLFYPKIFFMVCMSIGFIMLGAGLEHEFDFLK